MAIEPTRPIGSTNTLLFTGDLVLGSANKGAIPAGATATRNAVVPANIGAGDLVGIRFLLADATDPTDLSTTLPTHVYDDAQPAGASPHAPAVTAGSGDVYFATDLVMGATWTKNVDVRVIATNSTDQALITYVGAPVIVLDEGATSGLGLSTGLPVVVVPMIFNQAAAAWGANPISVRVEITVRHTTGR